MTLPLSPVFDALRAAARERILILDGAMGTMIQREALDELTAIVADMCGEEQAVIDDLDVVDLVAVGAAFLGFFPALQSLASGASPTT